MLAYVPCKVAPDTNSWGALVLMKDEKAAYKWRHGKTHDNAIR